MSKLPPAILFDWDNTLINTLPLIADAYNAIHTAFGMPVWSMDEVHAATQHVGAQALKKHYGDRWQEAERIFYEYIGAHHLSNLSTMDGAAALISGLHAMGVPMGIVSNKRGGILRAEVEYLGWTHFFKAVYGPDDVGGVGKPDPSGLLAALQAMAVPASMHDSCWYIGDTENDLRTASAAKTMPVYIGGASYGILAQNPAFCFVNCRECLDYLNNLVDSRSIQQADKNND